jgi:hypothetical protein
VVEFHFFKDKWLKQCHFVTQPNFLMNLQQAGLETNFKNVPEFLIRCRYSEYFQRMNCTAHTFQSIAVFSVAQYSGC